MEKWIPYQLRPNIWIWSDGQIMNINRLICSTRRVDHCDIFGISKLISNEWEIVIQSWIEKRIHRLENDYLHCSLIVRARSSGETTNERSSDENVSLSLERKVSDSKCYDIWQKLLSFERGISLTTFSLLYKGSFRLPLCIPYHLHWVLHQKLLKNTL